MSDGSVTLAIEDGIAVITLDRAGRRNAMDEGMWEGLADCVDRARRAEVRALVVHGAGGHFCSGMDLKPDNPITARAAGAVVGRDRAVGEALLGDLKGYLATLRTFPVPTIAAIEGAAVGGGFEIALHCDIRIAARDSRIGLSEVRIGMIPDVGGTALLTRLVGPGKAAAIICGGKVYSGEIAHELGMVEDVCDHGAALGKARSLAERISAGGPKAVRAAIAAIREMVEPWTARALDIETRAGVDALVSGEGVEGVQAFIEKRAPRW